MGEQLSTSSTGEQPHDYAWVLLNDYKRIELSQTCKECRGTYPDGYEIMQWWSHQYAIDTFKKSGVAVGGASQVHLGDVRVGDEFVKTWGMESAKEIVRLAIIDSDGILEKLDITGKQIIRSSWGQQKMFSVMQSQRKKEKRADKSKYECDMSALGFGGLV